MLRRERGTALLLVPAGLLVVLVLGAIAVDLSSVHLARRELERSLAVAADDAASMVDTGVLRESGVVVLDPDAAERVVRLELAAARLPGRVVGSPHVVVDARAGTVDVTATLEVDPVFGAVAGRGPERVTASARGRLLDVPATSGPP